MDPASVNKPYAPTIYGIRFLFQFPDFGVPFPLCEEGLCFYGGFSTKKLRKIVSSTFGVREDGVDEIPEPPPPPSKLSQIDVVFSVVNI